METRITFGPENVDFITGTKTPIIQLKDGGAVLAFNEQLDMLGVPEHLRGWAQRWAPTLRNENAFVANSVLDKREWAELDRAIYEMVKLRQNAMADLRGRGLVKPVSLAAMVVQWRMASERVAPSISMDGATSAEADRTDRKTYGVPVPIFRTDFRFGRRELLSSRSLGSVIDTFEAGEAAAAVVEAQEKMLFDGESNVVVQGFSIDGYTSHSSRDTDTAGNYGGGDFGTESNGIKTVLGMLAALAAKRYHGPFMGYVAQTQYHELLKTHTDGSGQQELARIIQLPQIVDLKASDYLTAGELVLVQMTPNVVDWIEALAIENREWESGDGQSLMFAVMAAGVPRLKADVAGNLGVAHATGC